MEIANQLDFPEDGWLKERTLNWYQSNLKQLQLVAKIDNIHLLQQKENGRIRLFLVSDNQPIGYVAFSESHKVPGWWYVPSTWLDSKFRGQALMAKTYKWFLNQGYKLHSDGSQTVSGKKIWKSLWKLGVPLSVGIDGEFDNLIPIQTEKDFDLAYDGNGYTLLFAP